MTLRRFYCSFDAKTASVQLYYTQQWHWQRKLIALKTIKLPLNGQKLSLWLEKQLNEELKKIQQLKLSRQFWQIANPELKNALLISIYLRRIHPRGVFNVFIDNWLQNNHLNELYQAQKNWFQDWNLRNIYQRMVRSVGFHQKSLRFDQIHLTQDKIDQKNQYSIHYDLYNNNHLKKFGLIKHILFEDGKNKKLI